MSPPWQALAEATVDELLELRPELATELGEHRHDDRLEDLSAAGRAAQARALRARRDALDSLDLDALDVDEAVDADLLRTGLDRRLLELEQLPTYAHDPLAWLPGDALHPLLVRDTTPVADRLRALASRMRQVPDRLALSRRELGELAPVSAQTAAQQCDGAARMVREDVRSLLAQEPGLAADVEPAQEAAARALDEHAAWLRVQPTPHDPRLGEGLFAAQLHLVLDAELTAAQVVQAAHEHLAEVQELLERTARDWVGSGPDPVGEALARAASDVPDAGSVVALARTAMADATAFLRELGVVTVPDDPCEVELMPEARRGVSVAYCDAPGALEEGGTTQFAISPPPTGWSSDRVASFWREYNTAMITNLTVHEAVPGHVLQLAHARRHRGTTRVRRVFSSGAFVEGWAVHAEQLMAEAGHGGVPVRLQQLKMQLRMTINALLDAGVHAGGTTEAEGLALMTGPGRQEEGEAVGKWRRALLTSGQLSTYFVGHRELAPMLADRTSYDAVLAHGNPPPRHLRTLLAAAEGPRA